MVRNFLALFACVIGGVIEASPLTVILVRHAEKAAAPADDPPLTPPGRRRAETLAWMLRTAGVETIYATEFKRTQQTVGPLAAALHQPVKIVKASDTGALVKAILGASARVSVVAGHSNTIPEIIAALGGGPIAAIVETEYDKLFIATVDSPGKARVLTLRFAVSRGSGENGEKRGNMKITFVRSGGLVPGLRVAGVADLDASPANVKSDTGDHVRDLTAEEAAELRKSAEALASAGLRGDLRRRDSSHADQYQYDITVSESNGKSRTLTVGDRTPEQVSPAAGKMLEWVRQEVNRIWSARVKSAGK